VFRITEDIVAFTSSAVLRSRCLSFTRPSFLHCCIYSFLLPPDLSPTRTSISRKSLPGILPSLSLTFMLPVPEPVFAASSHLPRNGCFGQRSFQERTKSPRINSCCPLYFFFFPRFELRIDGKALDLVRCLSPSFLLWRRCGSGKTPFLPLSIHYFLLRKQPRFPGASPGSGDSINSFLLFFFPPLEDNDDIIVPNSELLSFDCFL